MLHYDINFLLLYPGHSYNDINNTTLGIITTTIRVLPNTCAIKNL